MNPNAKPLEPELVKFEKKILAGAEFFQTQVVFNIETAKNFLKETSRYDVPVLIGIFPLRSYGVAEYFDKNVPGVKVPKELLQELAKTGEKGGIRRNEDRAPAFRAISRCGGNRRAHKESDIRI